MTHVSPSIWPTFYSRLLALVGIILCPLLAHSQQFHLQQQTDSLWLLILESQTPVQADTFALPWPVYRLATGDINGDGHLDAAVGVFKSSRYFPQASRRVLIFKDYNGYIRPLWMGSRLGYDLVDFDVIEGNIRAIEQTSPGVYQVSDYSWNGFGVTLTQVVATPASLEACYEFINPQFP